MKEGGSEGNERSEVRKEGVRRGGREGREGEGSKGTEIYHRATSLPSL